MIRLKIIADFSKNMRYGKIGFSELIFITLLSSLHFGNANEKHAPKIQLNNGHWMPMLGLGTYLVLGEKVEYSVKYALDVGYQHIDTAWIYGNEKEVGNAIRAKIEEGVIKREDIFVTTKLWNAFHKPNLVAQAFQSSLDKLDIEYIDLFLMHMPFANPPISKTTNEPTIDFADINPFPVDERGQPIRDEIDYMVTWKAMEKLVATGKVRSLGVSNFNSEQLERVIKLGQIKPVVNQVECHPNLNQHELIKFAKARNVQIVGHSSMGEPNQLHPILMAIHDPKVKEIAMKHDKNPGQILARFLTQRGVVAIPMSTNETHIRGNLNTFDFELDQYDMAKLYSINYNSPERIWKFLEVTDKNDKNYPFNIPF